MFRSNYEPFYLSRGEYEVTDRILTDVKDKKIEVGTISPLRPVHRYAAAKLQRSFRTVINDAPGEGELAQIRIEGYKRLFLTYLGTFADAGVAYYEPLISSGMLAEQDEPAIRDSEELNILKGLSRALHER